MKRYTMMFLILMGLLFVLSGCGGGVDLGSDDSVCAPPDATITIVPSSNTITDLGVIPAPEWHTTTFTITVKDKNGIPLNDVDLWITFPWAVPDSLARVQLFDGNTPKDSPMHAITDENGVFNLRFDYQFGGGIQYFGDLEVRSCSVYQKATFTVTAGTGG